MRRHNILGQVELTDYPHPGILTPHLGRTGACLQLGARLQTSHNVIEDLSGIWRPPACMTSAYRAGPRLSVMSPHTNPASSRAVATTAVCAPFLADILRKVPLSLTCAAHE